MSKSIALILLFLLVFCNGTAVLAQNASPLGGVGSLQFYANDGTLLTSGVVYIYQAGTSTQATVYTDSTGTTTQPNPVTFGSGARASIWLANGTFVKVVLCVQNDGAFCSAGDILFSADQVPIGSSSSGGGGSPFTGIFISSTASPATSGTLRLASGDSVCWRNAAGSANLCFKKDSNDLLSWDGGSLKLPEVGAPSGVSGFDILWADNTAHRLKAVNNAGTAAQYVLSGNDIGTTDQVQSLHFGATQEALSSTAPTTGQVLQFVTATGIGGLTLGSMATVNSIAADQTGLTANVTATTLTTPSANGFYAFYCFIVETANAGTTSTLPSCLVNFTDANSSTALSIIAAQTNTNNTVGSMGQQTTTGANVNAGLYAKSGTVISYSTANYASNPASTMTYAVHVRLVGPF